MRKLKVLIAAFLLFFCIFPLGNGKCVAEAAADGKYYIGGMTAGFMLGAGGAEVIETSEVNTEDGIRTPAKDAGIKAGDCICAADGVRILNIKDLNEALARSGGKEIVLSVRRSGETAEIPIVPVKEKKSGKYKIGVLIRDTLSGIGTVTYIEKETGKFGSLGHKIAGEGAERALSERQSDRARGDDFRDGALRHI